MFFSSFFSAADNEAHTILLSTVCWGASVACVCAFHPSGFLLGYIQCLPRGVRLHLYLEIGSRGHPSHKHSYYNSAEPAFLWGKRACENLSFVCVLTKMRGKRKGLHIFRRLNRWPLLDAAFLAWGGRHISIIRPSALHPLLHVCSLYWVTRQTSFLSAPNTKCLGIINSYETPQVSVNRNWKMIIKMANWTRDRFSDDASSVHYL